MNLHDSPTGCVRSLRRRLEGLASPLALFDALTSGGSTPHTILLESAEPTSRQTQRSLLAVSSALEVECRGTNVRVRALNSNGRSLLPALQQELARFSPQRKDDALEMEIETLRDDWDEVRRLHADSPLSVLRSLLKILEPEDPQTADAIYLFGLFAYDLVEQFEPLPNPTTRATGPDQMVPDFRFLLADQLIVWDHLRQHQEAVVHVFPGEHFTANYYSGLDRIAHIADTAGRIPLDASAPAPGSSYPPGYLESVETSCSDHAFAEIVRRLQQCIVRGDVFQIVPSRTFTIPCQDALASYAVLRQLNPSPYLFFAHLGDFVLFGASPESAVKVDGRLRRLEISPIAGTRRRGLRPDGSLDPDWDSRIEAELRLDEKENAEHMMLVDLARNDVARVSKPGSRHVVDLARIDKYSHVMHLVSRVQGALRDELDALHAYQASMNMGTLTGAPKIKAMSLLREVEPGRRGHYGGAVGYLRKDGSLDTAIVIRSALVRDGLAHVRAGAGVVHDSDPRLEADETRRKAEAVLRAIARANALQAEGSARE